MRLPEIPVTNDQITMINSFEGINLSEYVKENQWSDLSNVNNDAFPALGSRHERAYLSEMQLTHPLALLGGEHLAYVDEVTNEDTSEIEDNLYYNDTFICDLLDKAVELNAAETRTEFQGVNRKLVVMGAYLCVFPDGIVYNTTMSTSDEDAFSSVKNTTTVTSVTFTPSTYGCEDITISTYSAKEPSNPAAGDYWMDTSTTPNVLKLWSANTSTWVSVGTTYVKVAAENIAVGFNAYDAATFSGVIPPSEDYLYNDFDFNKSNIIYKAYRDEDNDGAGDYLLIAGYINQVFTVSTEVVIERELPELDHVTEFNNRLWGCSSDAHEIYACKQGDPTNWYAYAGLDNDSYTVTTGEHGIFTGIATFNNTVLVFMEHGMYKIYGTKPSNFEVVWKPCRGVQYGSSKSVVQVGDYLYYKAIDGICVYDGSTEVISKALGNGTYYEAVAGKYKTKYYVCMRDNEYKYKLYVYDTAKGMWTIEESSRIWDMAFSHLGLYLIDDNYNLFITSDETVYEKFFPSMEREDFPETGSTYTYLPINSTDSEGTVEIDGEEVSSYYPSFALYPGDSIETTSEGSFDWYMITGDIGLETPYKHYLKRLDIRLQLDTNSRITVEIAYDRSEAYEHVVDYTCTRKRTISIPVRVKRCDSLKIKFSGHGEMKLFSIAKIIEDGSDI